MFFLYFDGGGPHYNRHTGEEICRCDLFEFETMEDLLIEANRLLKDERVDLPGPECFKIIEGRYLPIAKFQLNHEEVQGE